MNNLPKCDFVGTQLRCKQLPDNLCATGSFRIRPTPNGNVNLLFCCPKHDWLPRAERCETGMLLASKHYNSSYFSFADGDCVRRCYAKKHGEKGKGAERKAKDVANRCGKSCERERL